VPPTSSPPQFAGGVGTGEGEPEDEDEDEEPPSVLVFDVGVVAAVDADVVEDVDAGGGVVVEAVPAVVYPVLEPDESLDELSPYPGGTQTSSLYELSTLTSESP
jgi:hypothetical protein